MAGLPKEVAAERIRLITAYKAKGLTQHEMASKMGISQPCVHSFMKKHGLTTKAKGAYLRKLRTRDWGVETADPSRLSPDQLDTARRTGISPERFAWLCSCKRLGTRVGEHRGGNSIG
jgi:transcriptional regulator with XRE-family HTH domain